MSSILVDCVDKDYDYEDGDSHIQPLIIESHVPDGENQEQEFEILDKSDIIEDIPTLTGSVFWDALYAALYRASRIPSFSSVKGLAHLLTFKEFKRDTAEQTLFLLASVLSINPALAWWLMTYGGNTVATGLYYLMQCSVYNPSRVVIIYSLYKKGTDIKALFGY